MSEPFFRVRIVNRNTFPIVDHFDAVKYTFPSGKAVDVSMDAARHIFGFHLESSEEEVERYVTRRFGWNTPDQADAGRQYFKNIDMLPTQYKLVEVEPQPVEPVDADKRKPAPKLNYEAPAKPGRPRLEAKVADDADKDFGT